MINRNKNVIAILSAVLLMVFAVSPGGVSAAAEPTVNLGTAAHYSVLAGSTVTNTGTTTIGGDVGANVGVSSGTAVTGFPPGVITDGGTIHANDASAIQAQVDLTTAYNDAAGRPSTANLTGQDLGGQTLLTGVYTFETSAQLTGELTLDAQGDPEAVFIFQIGSTLTTASNSKITLINGARFCRVFWQVGSSATLGIGTAFVGHIFASESITANTSASIEGQLLAINGAVTLDTNTIYNGICDAEPTPVPEETTAETMTAVAAETTAETTAAVAAVTTVNNATTTAAPDETSATTSTDQGEIPKTAETDNYIIYGITMLVIASGLTILRWRRKLAKQKI